MSGSRKGATRIHACGVDDIGRQPDACPGLRPLRDARAPDPNCPSFRFRHGRTLPCLILFPCFSPCSCSPAASSPWPSALSCAASTVAQSPACSGASARPSSRPFIDILKLMGKRTMVPEGSNTFVFLWAPVVAVAAMAVAAAMIPIAGFYRPSSHLGDMLVLLYLITVPAVVLMLAGSALWFAVRRHRFLPRDGDHARLRGPLLLAIVAVALVAGRHLSQPIALSLADIVAVQREQGAFILDPMLWPAFLAYLTFIRPISAFLPSTSPKRIRGAEEAASRIFRPCARAPQARLGAEVGGGDSAWVSRCSVRRSVRPSWPAGLGAAMRHRHGLRRVACQGAALGRMRIDQAVLCLPEMA